MKKLSLFLLIPLFAMMLFSCQNECVKEEAENNDAMLYATLYVQKAAEYRALCKQAYQIGQLRLDQKVSAYTGDKKLAVVVDIDETVLDNSPHAARSIIENTDYPMYWDEWCYKAEALAIPGSVEFLNYAASKGVETFYISNRKDHLTEASMKNLQLRGFPFADEEHIMLRTDSRDKEIRRNKVRENYNILLYFGDNLGDFLSDFDDQDNKTRNDLVEKLAADFGDQYIVLPNPTYGSWMTAMTLGAPEGAKADSIYRTMLINF